MRTAGGDDSVKVVGATWATRAVCEMSVDCVAQLIDVHSNIEQTFIPTMSNRNGISPCSGGKRKMAASPPADRDGDDFHEEAVTR